MAYKLLITKEANNDINEIIGYIVNILKNPIAAGNLLDDIEKSYTVISDNPSAFSLCNDSRLRNDGYRKIIVKNYIVFYKVNEEQKTVYIMRVIYGRRDYSKIV